MRGMRHAIAAMAAQGSNLIVDEVMIGSEKEREYRALLSRFDVRFVGLFAPLGVLEVRERERGDREIGLARWQYARVHRGMIYDLEIDTTETTPLETAQRICDAFGLGRSQNDDRHPHCDQPNRNRRAGRSNSLS